MSEEAYDKKFTEMQKYLPFLRKIIERLKSSNDIDQDNPRKGQLQKMEMLHGLLTSKEKKLKIETLLKCEGVLKKLHSKMDKSNSSHSESLCPKSVAKEIQPKSSPVQQNSEIVDITGPSSPPASPTQSAIPTLPVEIPTERCSPITFTDDIPKPTKNGSQNSTNSKSKQHHDPKKYNQNIHSHQRPLEKPMERLSSNNNRSAPQSQTSIWNSSHTPLSSIPTIITTAAKPSPVFRNTEPHVRNFDKHKWYRQNELLVPVIPANSKHHSNIRSHEQVALSDNRKGIDSTHIPDRKWDEFSKADSIKKIDRSNSATRPIPVVDSSYDSPNVQNDPKPFDKLIYQYKHTNTDSSAHNSTERKVFSRLGAKLDNANRTGPFENFSINVKNDRLKTRTTNPLPQQSTASSSSIVNSKISPALSIPTTKVTQPPLADVLKSPPLTAIDISNLMNETVCSASEPSSLSSISISGIGTRRPPKSVEPKTFPTTPASSLDYVRKKFAMITKNSPQYSDSPASPPPLNGNVPISNERIALKYNPHPRANRVQRLETLNSPATGSHIREVPTTNLNESPCSSFNDMPTPAPFNVLPTINLSDPRLKKPNTAAPTHLQSIPSLLNLSPIDIENATSMFVERECMPLGKNYPTAASNSRPYRNETHSATSQNQNNFNYQPASKNNVQYADSPEENWDSDPENPPPTVTVTPKASEWVEPAEKNQRVNASKDYSSEENWDSDPEPATVNAKKNQPVVSNINMTSPLKSSSLQPLVTSPSLKADPRFNRGAAVGIDHASIHTRTNINLQTFAYNYIEDSRIPKAFTSPCHGGFGQQNPQQQQQLNTNTRFSALMNDKTERMKYFESKKQKHMEPRTYAEFKEAKARAATKEVTATSATPAASAPLTVIPQAKESVKQNKQNKYDSDKRVKDTKIKNLKGKEFVVPKKSSPPETNLDKLYRGKSFSGSSELPKTIAKFKIPRKHNESKKSGIEGELQKESSTEKESTNTEEPENVENSKNQYDTKNKCVDKKQGVKLAKNKGTTLDTKITEPQEDIQSDNNKSKASERLDTGRKDKKTDGKISDVEHKNKKKNKKSNLNNVEIKKIKSANSEDIQLKKDKKQKNINGNNEEIIDEKSNINNEEINNIRSANSEDIKLKNDKEKSKINENYAEIIGEKSNINNEEIKHIKHIQLKNDKINDNDTEIIAEKSKINNKEIKKIKSVHFEDIQLKKDEKPDKINENYAEKSNINDEEIKYADSEDMALRQDKKHNKIIENDVEIIGELMINDNIRTDSETIATNNDHLKSEDVNQNHEKSSESQVVDEVHVTSEEGDVCKSSKVKTNLSPVKFLSPDAIFKFSNSSLQPQRILRRRCTMISYGSAPEVDKEKINNENALLFEDLHDHQKRLEEAEEIKKRVNRKNRNLAEIFQKTDDNCTVSTQNIISGKRRTRTTVNFNEVQQSLAAFRQNKPTTDVKKEPKDFDEESEATKPPKKETKKVTKKMNKAVRKKNVEDQSSTVSSTTSQVDENSSCSGKVVNKKKALELASDNEPSSSPKSNIPSATLDEDQRKQEFLEKMLQDMNNPNSNHEFIFSLLSQILSQEKFEQVKNILESSAKENILQITTADDAEEAESVVAEEQNDSALQQSTSPKANTRNNTGKTLGKRTTLKRKRANELDRLNLDIRHMFISEGVITATGRRMCTLAAVGENKPQIAVNKKSEDASKKSPSTQDYKNTNHIHIRKSKVVISPLNLNLLRRSMRTKNDDESNSGDEVNDENVQTTIVTTRSPTPTDQKDASLYRKMPVLKPNTPIKLVEEEQQLEAIEEKLNLKSPTTAGKKRKLTKLIQSKPCPKSKKPFSVVLPDDSIATSASTEEIAEDSEDDLQLAHLCKRLKSNSSVMSIDNTSQKAEKVILNTNPHWHALSKYSHWCFFCDAKFRHIAIHYKQKHHNAESFPSRIAPTILQQYKQGKLSAPIFGTKSKQQTHWFYRCPFCLQHSRTITRCWLEHFIKHTGEYFFECSECYKTANKTNKIDIHLRNSCPGGKIIRREYQTSTKLIKAHICHMCNFLQLNRINLERHYIEQHGCNPEHVTVLGYSINLFNADGAAVVDEETAAKMEAAAVEKYTQESVVNIDDDDEEQEVYPPGSTEAMKTNDADECLPDVAKANKQSNDTKNVISETYETQSGSAFSDKSIAEKNPSTGSSLNKAATIKLPKKLAKLESAAKKSLLKSIGKKDGSEDKRKLRNSFSSNSSNEASVSKTEDLQTESERIAKFIVDVQDDVLAAAAKAEAEENAREEALRSNIFMPTERSNTDSPTIQCLTESLRTIEQAEEQLQQQQSTYTVSNVAGQGNQTLNTVKTSNSSPSISMAERLSQRFKDIKVRTVAEEVPKVALNATSANSSFSESSTSSKNLVIVEDENKKDQDKEEREEEDEEEEYEFGNQQEPKENDTEDDGNWEDIEISECAPSATSTIGNSGKEKQKQKRIYQSIKRLYATINNKKPTNNKKKALVTMFNKKQQQSRNQQTESIKTSDSPTPQATSKVRPLLANLQDLLPDSPCNDPMELVPELAPVEPLQDLNDISSILEANFSALDAQSILQQMDMTITADTICINADGQQQSIQDALEFVTEQQEEQDGGENSVNVFNQLAAAVKIGQNQLQTVINRVQNLGYSKNTETGTKFYCISENCSFLFSNESFGLESHFLNEHPHIRWSGFCCICNNQVVEQQGEAAEVFQISQEMQHMLEKHIQISEESAHQDRENLLRDEEEATTQYSITKFDSMPRIKLRRLTGDCLSTTPTSLSTPEAAESSQPNDLTNISLSDLLRAEPRPVNFKSFLNTQEEHTAMSMAETVKNQTDRDSLPLFKNIGNEFTITSVASGATEIGMPLQISTVRSLSDCSQATIASTESTSTLPKISNVCSLNSLAAGQKSKNSAGSLWQKQIELDRIELKKAEKESRELSRIMHNNLHRHGNPSNDKIGDLFTEAMRDSDSPTLVAETLPVSTATSGEFLITQTISAQYEENVLNGPNSGPQLGINISIAPKTSQVPTNARTTATSVPEEGPATIRPQFKCMGNFCKYQTCVSVAMIEHLRFHERRNFSTQHEYLRCSFCDHFSDDVDLYIKHAVEQHPVQLSLNDSQNATKNVSTKCALTQKIQDILKVNHEGRRSSSSSNSNDTISTTTPAEVPFTQQLLETIKEMVSNTGLPESKLYRCVIEGCKTALNESSFHTHIIYHLSTLGTINVNNYNYKCPHCKATYQRPTGIKAHIKSHGRHRFFCFQCMGTTNNPAQMLKHFCEKHWKVSTLHTIPMCTTDTPEVASPNNALAQYILAQGEKHLTALDVQQFAEKLIAEWQRKKAAAKTHFKPNEINLLPIQPIFQNEVHCSDCLYKTKVRTNMFRHLQLHKSSTASNGGVQLHMASVDPVNPVPCLNSNERHFDKMCNLASSSVATGTAASATSTKSTFKPPYAYVAEMRRFACGVAGCHYLAVSEEIFRSHLSALHQNLTQYCCPFCKEELCINQRSPAMERILQHLRMHGPKLYQCKECDYLHYMKGVVERHIFDRHAALRVNLITHERSVDGVAEGTKATQTVTGKKFKEPLGAKPVGFSDSPNNACNPASSVGITANSTTASSTLPNSKQKWECDLCRHRTGTHNQMIHHCSVQHACKQQYQCVHCQFGSTQLVHIMTHIDEKHPAKTREARYIFHKIFSSAQEKEADTRPLWQRDDPTRVRHIRGILMEDEEESEQFGKRLGLDEENDEEFEEFVSLSDEKGNKTKVNENEIISNIEKPPTVTLENESKLFEFGCYHCDFKTESFDKLKNNHWKTAHNSITDVAKPFYFRLLKTLKCAECNTFKGDHNSLQLHMQNAHQTRVYIAADAEESNRQICGYCEFSYTRTVQLIKHYQRVGHKPQDIKKFTAQQLESIKRLGTPETYVQCMLCMDLFANRMAIVEHAHAKHESEDNFSFKELRDQIIYRCAICSFAAADELKTMRHMIDHYGSFKYCYFCRESQTTFNGYMQHCYTEHRQEIKRFSEIYTIKEISKYLQQVFVIFPNGFMINKKNLYATLYGGDINIHLLYKEICKISQEPPIPRLSIARLVARKSIEAKQASRNGSPNPCEADQLQSSAVSTAAALQLASDNSQQIQASKISKRRKTVAFGCRDECFAKSSVLLNDVDAFAVVKKRKVSENILSTTSSSLSIHESVPIQDGNQPYSFYGKKLDTVDLTKIYTNVAIGGLDTPLTIDKFKMLFKIDAQVVIDKLDVEEISKKTESEHVEKYRNVKKACPASQKFKYI